MEYWRLKYEFVRERRRLLKRKLLIWTAAVMIILLAGTYIIFHTLFGVAVISESSMVPMLESGDVVFYRRARVNPSRGDVVVFKAEYSGEKLVKRIVATEGDTVIIPGDGKVYINGAELSEPYLKMTETYPGEGVEYPLKVPKGYLFVLGDNREVSLDSRFDKIGLVPVDKVTGILSEKTIR